MRLWNVWFAGDLTYGRETVSTAMSFAPAVCEAVDASSAARKAMAEWRQREPREVREEGFYGDGSAVYVQEVVEPPPVVTFVRTNGRMKLERRVVPVRADQTLRIKP